MRTMGPYRVGARLARGANGDLHLAALDGKAVALRLFDPRFGEDLGFELDLTAAANQTWTHRCPVGVLDAGRDGTRPYVAMELVEGQPLSSFLKKARLEGMPISQSDFLALMRPVVEAVVEAHRREEPATHGRLAPQDIIIDQGGRPRLVGLGFGKVARRLDVANRRLGFVAPEVMRNEAPSRRSDAFSVAALLYDGLTGRAPFRRPQVEDTRHAVLHGDLAPIKVGQLEVDPTIGDWITETLVPRAEARPDGLEYVLELIGERPAPALEGRVTELFAPELEGLGRMKSALGAASGRGAATADSADVPALAERDVEVVEAEGRIEQVARYRLLERVYADGQVEEHLGVDPNLDRRIRVRLLRPEVPDGRLDHATRVRVFKREARYLAMLDHEAFPVLLDAGRAKERYFAVFVASDGMAFPRYVARGGEVDILRMGRDLGGAVSQAHRSGVVVGELRLDAVAIQSAGGARFERLPCVGRSGGSAHPLLDPSSPWSSPELRTTGRWTEASDQYALGLLLIAAATGAEPEACVELVRQPKQTDLEPRLAHILERMVAERPQDRFPTVASARRALLDLAESEAGSPWTVDAPAPRAWEGLHQSFAELCYRSAGLSVAPSTDPRRDFEDPSLVASAVARRRGLDLENTRRVLIATALRDLARRTHLEPFGPEILALAPQPVRGFMEELEEDRSAYDGEHAWSHVSSVHSADIERAIVRLAEGFVEAQEDGAGLRGAIERLRDVFAPELVRALALHVEEATGRQLQGPDQGRVLLAGSEVRTLEHALRRAGFSVILTDDGHEAWELLRGSSSFRGGILSQSLRGRDGLSLIRLCRSSPDLAELPLWLEDATLDTETRLQAEEQGAVVVDGAERFDLLHAMVQRRLAPSPRV